MAIQTPTLSSLPPELVHQIIESTVPHSFHSTTYHERQRTLCCLSLVSKLFQSIAQPLLFEIVKLKRIGDAEKLPTARAAGGGTLTHARLRWFIVKDWIIRTQEKENRLGESLRFFHTARNLTLSFMDERTFASLLSVTSSHLTYLQVSSSHFEPSKTILLPSLHSLILYNVSYELFRSLVDLSTAPDLRNLALVGYFTESIQWLETTSISRFLLQLETLYFDFCIWSELEESFRRLAAPRTLVNLELDELISAINPGSFAVHVRLDYLHESDFNYFRNELDSFASDLQHSSSLSLKSFYLDCRFHDPSILPPFVVSSVDNLARICQERKIDLVFEQLPASYDLDPFISSKFIRKQKEFRVNEAGEDGVIR